MLEIALLIHFITIALAMGLNSLGAGIGEGIAGCAALRASDKQPQAHSDIVRVAFIGTALIETTAIIGIFIAIMLLLEKVNALLVYGYISQLGIAFATCISGFVVGIVSAFPVKEACEATARQPFLAQKILGFTVVALALVQTPIIAGFIIALLIQAQHIDVTNLADALRLIASGLCIGVGGVGPAIGLANFAKTGCKSIGINREAYVHLFSFTLISQTLIETPVVFAFIISLIMLFFVPHLVAEQILMGIGMIAAAISTGIGTLGPAINSSITAAAACKAIAYNPQQYALLSRTSMLAQVLIETCAIYAVLVSLAIIFMAQYIPIIV